MYHAIDLYIFCLIFWNSVLIYENEEDESRNVKGVNICQEWDLLGIAFTKKD